MVAPKVTVMPIRRADAGEVGDFLHCHLNARVSSERWARVIDTGWPEPVANHGFRLVSGGETVGIYAAVYSERDLGGEDSVVICNLAAFCVLREFRSHGFLLVRALLAQRGLEFTDLSPSGSVVAMNERLGFKMADTATAIVGNWPRSHRQSNVRITSGDTIEFPDIASVRDVKIYRDHRDAPAARHLFVESGESYAYLIFRRDRRKGLPLFASPLYVGGDRRLLKSAWKGVSAHLFTRYKLPATLAERRVLGFTPPGPSFELSSPRPKMFRGRVIDSTSMDYLYSELMLVEW